MDTKRTQLPTAIGSQNSSLEVIISDCVVELLEVPLATE